MSEASIGSPGYNKPVHQYGESFPGAGEQDELLAEKAPEVTGYDADGTPQYHLNTFDEDEDWAGQGFIRPGEEESG